MINSDGVCGFFAILIGAPIALLIGAYQYVKYRDWEKGA